MIRAAALAGTALLAAGGAAAQEAAAPERPAILGARFDEDWRPLCEPSRRTEPLDRLKCIPLGQDGLTLTLGGELRERFETVRNPVFGFEGVGRDEVLLHRLLVHADLRWSDRARVFVQLGDHRATARDFGRAPTDVDRLDLQQGFLDLSTGADARRATLRAGRQEMSFGSARLISVRESPNVRRSFDGVRGFVSGDGWRVDAFAVHPVRLSPGTFDDTGDRRTEFWGVYASELDWTGPLGALDLYYLGYETEAAAFAQGTGRERRHSVGARLSGTRGGFDWDVETVRQWGRFGSADIAAWTVASDSGFTFADAPWRPRLGLKADLASGDEDPADGTLGTFNALFPKFPYFTEANVVAPANLVDLQPSLTLAPSDAVELAFGLNLIWKHRLADAFYGPPLTPVPGTAAGAHRFVGSQASLAATWRLSPGVVMTGAYTHFEPGVALDRAGGRVGDFLTVSAAYRF